MNSQSNQSFSSFDLVTMLAAIVAIFVITGPILYNQSDEENRQKAQQEALIISKQIQDQLKVQISSNQQETSQGREIASDEPINWEGIVGQDPWGQPYHYRTIRNAYGLPTHLIVWSKGPNAYQDTKVSVLNNTKDLVFEGDDIGSFYSLR